MVKVLLIGATGYQGGALLLRLLKHRSKYDITALVRSEASAAKLRALGVDPILGSFKDLDLIRKAAEEADVVFSLASADDLEPVQAVVQGLKAKGKKGIFIHSSGTGVLADDSRGNSASDTVYSDLDLQKIRALPPTQLHKNVDDRIYANATGITALVVAPPLIYGLTDSPFHNQSQQIPALTRAYVKLGKVATVGKGEAIWPCVHVADLAALYELLLDKALAGQASTVPDGGWYFAENGEFKWKELAIKIGDVLHKKGLVKDTTLTQFTEQEIQEYLFGNYGYAAFGSNARCKAERSRQLGWEPTHPSLWEQLPADVDAVLATMDLEDK
jgi:nucleoside-diphosphate-sugar epimerase